MIEKPAIPRPRNAPLDFFAPPSSGWLGGAGGVGPWGGACDDDALRWASGDFAAVAASTTGDEEFPVRSDWAGLDVKAFRSAVRPRLMMLARPVRTASPLAWAWNA